MRRAVTLLSTFVVAFVAGSLAIVSCQAIVPGLSSTAHTPAERFAVRAPARLGIVTDRTFRVVSVDEGGAAAAAGLNVGDTLVTLDDLSFETETNAIVSRVASFGETVAIDDVRAPICEGDCPSADSFIPAPGALGDPKKTPTAPEQDDSLNRDLLSPSQVFLHIVRSGKSMTVPVDLAVQTRYGLIPTPTAMPPGDSLYYF